MWQVNVHEAKSQLSRLIEQVLAGEQVTIARAGKPVVDLVIHRTVDVHLGADAWRHSSHDESLFDGVDDEIEEMFYGSQT